MFTGSYVMVGLSIPSAFLTITGNTAFLFTLLRTSSLQTPLNVLLGALCITDLLAGVLGQPLIISFLVSKPCCSLLLIKAFDFSFILITVSSYICILLISLDRFIAICYPYRYPEHATCWSYAYISAGLFILTTIYAIVEARFYIFSEVTFRSIQVVFQLLIFVVVMIMFALIYKVNFLNNCRSVSQHSGISTGSRKEWRKTQTAAIIVAVFIACYVTFVAHTLKIFLDHLGKGEFSFMVSVWAHYFVLLNSCLNPIIYFARSKKLRRAAVRLFMPSMAYGRASTNAVANTEETEVNC